MCTIDAWETFVTQSTASWAYARLPAIELNAGFWGRQKPRVKLPSSRGREGIVPQLVLARLGIFASLARRLRRTTNSRWRLSNGPNGYCAFEARSFYSQGGRWQRGSFPAEGSGFDRLWRLGHSWFSDAPRCMLVWCAFFMCIIISGKFFHFYWYLNFIICLYKIYTCIFLPRVCAHWCDAWQHTWSHMCIYTFRSFAALTCLCMRVSLDACAFWFVYKFPQSIRT